MATRDYKFYAEQRERRARNARQDRLMDVRHAAFDLSAQDIHMKYERAHFAVVGEGSRPARENYRAGYERIFGGCDSP